MEMMSIYSLHIMIRTGFATEPTEEDLAEFEMQEREGEEGNQWPIDAYLTLAERRYTEEKERIEAFRLVKTSDKSHYDSILPT